MRTPVTEVETEHFRTSMHSPWTSRWSLPNSRSTSHHWLVHSGFPSMAESPTVAMSTTQC